MKFRHDSLQQWIELLRIHGVYSGNSSVETKEESFGSSVFFRLDGGGKKRKVICADQELVPYLSVFLNSMSSLLTFAKDLDLCFVSCVLLQLKARGFVHCKDQKP